MDKINVAYIIDTIGSSGGGTEGQLLNIIQKIDRKKFEPFLICLHSSDWLDSHQVRCKSLILELKSFKNPRWLTEFMKIVIFLKANKIQILQTFFKDSNILGIFAGKIAGVKTIISSRRDLGYWYTWKNLLFLKLTNRFTSRVLTNSISVKNNVVEREKIDTEKVDVIYNGIDISEDSDNGKKAELKLRFGITGKEPVVGLIANLRQVKGIDIFIKAVEYLMEKNIRACFLVVGEGPMRHELQQMCVSMGVDQQVKFLGRITPATPILDLLDVAVNSSRSEGFSNAVLEYMAKGLPVVATDVGGNSELIRNGETGLLVELSGEAIGNAVLQILSDQKLKWKLGKKAKKEVETKYTMSKMMAELESYYLKLVMGCARPGG